MSRSLIWPIDTVTTPLTSAWTDLTAIWAAATPPAADGETITVQPADTGAAHAIVIAQAAAPPTSKGGHLAVGGDLLRLTAASGRKHYGRAYMGAASVTATGEGAR